MKNILCFGDSNTWGLIAKTNQRYDSSVRWTGLLSNKLGKSYNVIEEGLCGRTTRYDDATRANRNASRDFGKIVNKYSNLDLIIIMLGTNDCKTAYHASPSDIGDGVKKLLSQINTTTPILLISPIFLGELVYQKQYDDEFNINSIGVSKRLKNEFSKIADEYNISFLAASDYASPSTVDYEHLDESGHKSLSEGIYSKVTTILN